MNEQKTKSFPHWLAWTTAVFVVLGIALRFLHINRSDFIFYDEGFYLNCHLSHFLEIMAVYLPFHPQDLWKAVYTNLQLSLGEGKALWFFIVDSRVFFGLLKAWYIPRVLAAIAGSLTLVVVFFFARRFFNSTRVAFLSVIFMSVLPSHVFYSRLGMQETLSTLFFISGFYFYIFPRTLAKRTFLSAVLFIGAYFTNYRLIVIPALVFFCEVWMSLSLGQKFGFRKYLWHILTFLLLLFLIGNIDRAQNIIVTFSWMFHQADLGQQSFDWFNFLSYPYYLFRLENFFFGVLFFGNVYYFYRRKFYELFPFAIVIVQMLIFSLAQDKAARYVCVVTPFMVMAVASLIVYLSEEYKIKPLKWGLVAITSLIVCGFILKSVAFANFKSDYRSSMEFLLAKDKEVKVLSTQAWVQNLYVSNRTNVMECPHQFPVFVQFYSQGYRYLVLDPQAYVSYTSDGFRFTPVLQTYLGFIAGHVQPIKTFPHFNRLILERFVFEHNENLKKSLAFLSSNDGHLGELRIYDVGECLRTIDQVMGSRGANK